MAEIRAGRTNPSIEEILRSAPWVSLEKHLEQLRERVDHSISTAHTLREKYRFELLATKPDLKDRVRRPSQEALRYAEDLVYKGPVAPAEGTISPEALLGGPKTQVGGVIVC